VGPGRGVGIPVGLLPAASASPPRWTSTTEAIGTTPGEG